MWTRPWTQRYVDRFVPGEYGRGGTPPGGGGGAPCRDDLVAWYKNGFFTTDGTKFRDKSATGQHEATPAVSLAFTGSEYGALDSAVTLNGDFSSSVSFYLGAGSADQAIFGGDSFTEGMLFYFNSLDNPQVGIGGATYNFNTLTAVPNSVNTLSVARSGTNLTVTLNGVSDTKTCLTSDLILRYLGAFDVVKRHFFTGNLWDIKVSDSTGVKFWNYLAQNSTDTTAVSTVGPDVTLVGTTGNPYEESVIYGHTWNGSEGYSFDVTDGVEQLKSWTLSTGYTLNPDGSISFDGTQTGTCSYSIPNPPAGSYTRRIFSLSNMEGTGSVGVGFGGWPSGEETFDTNGDYVLDYENGVSAAAYIRAPTGCIGTIRVDSIQYLHRGYVPASTTIPSQDVFGNSLTNPGSAQQNATVKGYTGDWDGATYGTLVSPVILSGDFGASGVITINAIGAVQMIATGNSVVEGAFAIGSGGSPYIWLDGINYSFNGIILSASTKYIWTLTRKGDDVTASFGPQSETITCNSSDFVVRQLFAYLGGSIFTGTIPYIKLYDSTDTLVNHWVVESIKDSYQPYIYDKIPGSNNHAELVGATLGPGGFWSVEHTPSELRLGGRVVENYFKDSEDFTQSTWEKFGSPIIATVDDYQTIQTTSSVTSLIRQTMSWLESGKTYTSIIDIRADVLDREVYISAFEMDYTPIGSSPVNDQISTDEFLRVSYTFTLPSAGARVKPTKSVADTDLYSLKNMQVVESVGASLYSTGDSICANARITDGSSKVGSYTARYAAANRLEFVNEGSGGETLAQIYARMQTDLASTTYPIIFVEGGYNDSATTIEVMKSTLDDIIILAKSKSTKAVIFGIPVASYSAGAAKDKAIEYNSYAQSVCDADSQLTYFDMTSVLSDGTTPNPLMYEVDTVHPNFAGHKALSDALVSQILLPDTVVRYPPYVETTDTAVPLSVIPNGATDGLPLTFNGPLDAPADVFPLNAVESLEMYNADQWRPNNVWWDASDVLQDVDPADLVPIEFSQFVGPSDYLLYSLDIDSNCLDKTEKYVGITNVYLVNDSGAFLVNDSGAYITNS